MSVYVDNLRRHNDAFMFGSSVWCHMLADSTEELVEMAEAIGLSAEWIQNPGTYKEHFDLRPRARRRAVQRGAIEINMRDVAEILKARRAAGHPLDD